MDIAFEQKIRQRAYEIWMAAGMVDGAADEHWLLAKNDVCDEPEPAKSTPVKAAKAKVASMAAPKAAKPKIVAKRKVAARLEIKVEKAAKSASKPTVRVARKAAAVEAHAGV